MPLNRPEEKFDFPKLDPDEDAQQRGETPRARGRDGEKLPPVDPERRKQVAAHVAGWLREKGRVRQNGLWPYLLIRATLGDHGVRPVPNGVAFWESPDILVVEGDVPSLAGQVTTLNPRAGAPHTVFVHAWNIGKLASYGTSVRVWWANPTFSFTDPAHPPHLIGGAIVDLPDRLNLDCHRVVRLPQLWTPVVENNGHECLLARIESFTDGSGGGFDARLNRHIGQRNLQLVQPQADLSGLMKSLSAALPRNAELHLLHGGKIVADVLRAHQPGLFDKFVVPARAPRQGVEVARGFVHLGAIVPVGPTTAQIIPPALLKRQRGGIITSKTLMHRDVKTIRAAELGDARANIPLRLNLAEQLFRSIGVNDLRAGAIAEALGAESREAHLLRLEARSGGVVIGGYTLIVTPTPF